MARYLIPEYKLPQLQKVINKIRNKGGNVTFEIIRTNIPISISPRYGNDLTINCVEAEVEGSYRLNGWDFVGTIEHASPENIIRVADQRFFNRIPERYRTAPKECEHCHIRRDRNDTYLVYNEDQDLFRQVGRTCLGNYTQGLDAEVCASMMSVLAELHRINAAAEQGDYDEDIEYLLTNGLARYPMEKAKKKAYEYVIRNGYISGQTGRDFADRLSRNSDSLPDATTEQINAVENWLRNTTQSDWSQNALAAWTKPYYERRDAGLITSAVAIYQREKEKEQARQNRQNDDNNTFAGNIGDKVTLVIDSVSVAFYNSTFGYPIYRIVSRDGKIYSWGCTKDIELVPGDVLEGTIKNLRELRNGDKCTELTRCKVIGHEDRYRGFFNS